MPNQQQMNKTLASGALLSGQSVGQLNGQNVGQLNGQNVGQLSGQNAGQLIGQHVGQQTPRLARKPGGLVMEILRYYLDFTSSLT